MLVATAKFQRGNLCAICIDPVNIATFFDATSSKLNVETTSFTKYTTEMNNAVNCLNDI